jgi:hypothetical protein
LRRQPSLRSQLNQIRLWVRQGRTDAWIAHKLDIGIDELSRFKREHQLDEDEAIRLAPADPLSVEAPEPRAEEPEREEEAEEEEDDRPARRPRESSRRRGGSRPPRRREPRPDRDEEPRAQREPRAARDDEDVEDDEQESADGGEPRRRRRRGRRGGRRHRARRDAFEATFDHGEEGYGLWLDPAVVDNPVYSEHWAGHRAVTVVVEADAITIRRAGADSPADGEEPGEPEDE